MKDTNTQYDSIVSKCKDLFLKKSDDYGTAWRIMRLKSITDQIFIKANRIRTIEETCVNKVGENIDSEYIGIINYCIIAIIQNRLDANSPLELNTNEVKKYYENIISETKELMFLKNHDYGEAWRDMRISSITDLILMKILRVKQIEDNNGKTIASEGIDANYKDMINYAIFALIRLSESE